MVIEMLSKLPGSNRGEFELTAAILPDAEIAPAMRPDWRRTFLDIILPTREA